MVLGLHGEALFAGIERRALGHRPRLQHAVAFEPEVVVQPRARECCWTTNSSGPLPAARPAPAAGSGVAVKRPLGRVFASGCSLAMPGF